MMLNIKLKKDDCYFEIKELCEPVYNNGFWLELYTNFVFLGSYWIKNRNVVAYVVKKIYKGCNLNDLLIMYDNLNKYRIG